MTIYTFTIAGHSVRLANDQQGDEPDAWKTSTDHDIWTPGEADLGQAIQHVIDSVQARERVA